MMEHWTLPPEILLAARDIEVRFPHCDGQTRAVVDHVDLDVRRHRVTALVGESGSGKTQLLHAVLGLTRGFPGVTTGRATLQPEVGRFLPLLAAVDGGARPRFVGRYAELKHHLCVVFQGVDSHLSPFQTIQAQFLAQHRLFSHSGPGADPVTPNYVRQKLAPLFPNPRDRDEVASRFPAELSGGQRTRVGLCLALASPARFVVADEPTTGLDPGLRAEIYYRLRHEIEQSRRSLLLITHDVDLVARFARDICIMRAGRVVEHVVDRGSEELRDPYSQLLFQPLHEIARRLDQDSVDGALPTPARRAAAERADTVVLRAEGLRKGFRARASSNGHSSTLWAVDGVDLVLRQGESVGLVGESGCGKSTLARLLAGLLRPNEGSIRFRPDPATRDIHPQDADYRSHVQLLHQNPDTLLHPRVTIRELCSDSLHLWQERCRFLAVDDFLRFARIDASRASQYPFSLCGGERRRIGLARVLAGRPDVVLADEVASGLDRVLQAWVLRYLQALRHEGLTLVIISHDLDLVRHACDRVLIMKEGKIVEECAAADLHGAAREHHPHTSYLLHSESLDAEPDPCAFPPPDEGRNRP